MPDRRTTTLLATALIAPVAVALALAFGHDPVEHAASRPHIDRTRGHVGSATCRSCHPDHHASWQQTFHRTMTQPATGDTVVGAFDGRSVAFAGRSATVRRDGERFLMDVPVGDGGSGIETREVALAVGSRRYQQYFERVEIDGGVTFRRLPLLWHIEAGRWMHLNGAFLEPENPDWDHHRATWNQNCIFCHNTAPSPGAHDPSRLATGFDSTLAEWGIACESCHGPGAEHVASRGDPVARWVRDPDAADPTIVHPARLDPGRRVAICGQCHGQRLPEPRARIEAWLTTGPTFRPGDVLTAHVAPLTIDTPPLKPTEPELFRQRFWADGTPRLTAYEYQGITASPCFPAGTMSCESCHAMHGGDPHGMIEPELRGDRACTQCHAEYAAPAAAAAHSRHPADSSGARCLDCHMPRIVYGILDVHRSHRIEIPDPARDTEAGRPNACTLCHLDYSPRRAAEAFADLFGSTPRLPARRPDGASLDLPDAVASLIAGDAVQRVVYAKAYGEPGVALAPAHRALDRAVLATTLCDAYPSIRWRAEQSLRAIEAAHPTGLAAILDRHDVYADLEARRAVTLELFTALARSGDRLAAPPPNPFVDARLTTDVDALVTLLNRQSRRVISIGE